MKIGLTFDPDKEADVDRVRKVIELLESKGSSAGVALPGLLGPPGPFDPPINNFATLYWFNGGVENFDLNGQGFPFNFNGPGTGTVTGEGLYPPSSQEPPPEECQFSLTADLRQGFPVETDVTIVCYFDRPVPAMQNALGWNFFGGGTLNFADGSATAAVQVLNLTSKTTLYNPGPKTQSRSGTDVTWNWNFAGDKGRVVAPGDMIRVFVTLSTTPANTDVMNAQLVFGFSTCYYSGIPCS
jgi:hypothetical protein